MTGYRGDLLHRRGLGSCRLNPCSLSDSVSPFSPSNNFPERMRRWLVIQGLFILERKWQLEQTVGEIKIW